MEEEEQAVFIACSASPPRQWRATRWAPRTASLCSLPTPASHSRRAESHGERHLVATIVGARGRGAANRAATDRSGVGPVPEGTRTRGRPRKLKSRADNYAWMEIVALLAVGFSSRLRVEERRIGTPGAGLQRRG